MFEKLKSMFEGHVGLSLLLLNLFRELNLVFEDLLLAALEELHAGQLFDLFLQCVDLGALLYQYATHVEVGMLEAPLCLQQEVAALGCFALE